MDDGRGPGVEEVKAFQDLPAPTSQHFGLHNFETLQVTLGKRKKDINFQWVLLHCTYSIADKSKRQSS